MPPKKKRIPKARKAELVFLERPREGPVHCYETPLPSAKNPRLVPTKPVGWNTSAAWVCPQFETTKSVVLKARQKQHRGLHRPQDQDANHSSLHAGGPSRRATACKFSPLTFENAERYPRVCPSDGPNHLSKDPEHSHSQPKEGRAARAEVQVDSLESCRGIPVLPAPRPAEPEGFSPPDVETPEVPSMRNWSTGPHTSSCAWLPEELACGADPCSQGQPAAVLVPDTPEHEYGVKMTWRRRPRLMGYLLERG
ncbi:RHNO1 protein, partial [Aegotheles bennettii]|nr:RHNO1 protein [Aegotheles bennettii]